MLLTPKVCIIKIPVNTKCSVFFLFISVRLVFRYIQFVEYKIIISIESVHNTLKRSVFVST